MENRSKYLPEIESPVQLKGTHFKSCALAVISVETKNRKEIKVFNSTSFNGTKTRVEDVKIVQNVCFQVTGLAKRR